MAEGYDLTALVETMKKRPPAEEYFEYVQTSCISNYSSGIGCDFYLITKCKYESPDHN